MSAEPKIDALVSFLNGASIVHGWWAGAILLPEAQPALAMLAIGMGSARYCIRGNLGDIPPGAIVDLEEEGTVWVRGHVSENDEVGRALLTVAALRERETFAAQFHLTNPRSGHPCTLAHGTVLVHGYWFDWGPSIKESRRYEIRAFVETTMGNDTTDVCLDQGIRWVRGHVTENDPAGRALLTITTLTTPDLRENDRSFINGEIDEATWRRNVDLWDAALARGEDVC